MIIKLLLAVRSMAITATVFSPNTPYTGQNFNHLGDAAG